MWNLSTRLNVVKEYNLRFICEMALELFPTPLNLDVLLLIKFADTAELIFIIFEIDLINSVQNHFRNILLAVYVLSMHGFHH